MERYKKVCREIYAEKIAFFKKIGYDTSICIFAEI